MKSQSADFQEMFSSSSIEESLNADAPVLQPAPEPWLPTDDRLWEFLTVGSTKAAAQLEDQALIAEISGYEQAAVPQAVPAPELVLESRVVDDFIKRTASVLAGIPRHKQAMQRICDRLGESSALAPVRNDPHWESLIQAMTAFVTGSIFAGC